MERGTETGLAGAGRVRNGGQRPVWQGPDGCGTGDRDPFGSVRG